MCATADHRVRSKPNRLQNRLEQLNRQRQQIEEEITGGRKLSDSRTNRRLPSCWARVDWHLGVVGIVSPQDWWIFHRPSIVIAVMRGAWEGSARTVEDLICIKDCPVPGSVGGLWRPSSAAGLTIKRIAVEEFRQLTVLGWRHNGRPPVWSDRPCTSMRR